MKSLRIELLIAAALPLAGCMPMEQVSLVYSSKADIGVGIATGTTATPGLDVHIGYHSLDAAFVPVAFAKHCAAPATCSGISYNPDKVTGSNIVQGRSASEKQRIDTLDNLIRANEAIVQGKQTQIDNLNASIASIDNLTANTSERDQLVTDPATGAARVLNADQQARVTTLNEEIGKAVKLPPKATLTASRDGLIAENKKLEETIAEEKKQRDQVLALRDSETADTKTDAFSVYGTFNGTANGGRDAAALTGGKVFSTGIAAQNLSQGVRDAERTNAMARCLMMATTLLAAPGLKDADRANIANMCALTVSKD